MYLSSALQTRSQTGIGDDIAIEPEAEEEYIFLTIRRKWPEMVIPADMKSVV
jgi:hypothetical protein